MEDLIFFDIEKIYTLVHKTEHPDFRFSNPSRHWDGFIALTDGEMIFENACNQQTTLRKGDIVFLERFEKYSVYSKRGCSYFTSAYDFSESSHSTLELLPKSAQCNKLQLAIIEEITNVWQQRFKESFMHCKIELLKIYFDFLKHSIGVKDYSNDETTALAIKFIHENFKRNFKTKEIAKYCAISPSHLRLKFANQTNMTITEYRDDLRIKTAKEILSSGHYSVKEAAAELGFCDVYYFTKFFAEKVGITPAKYKKERL